MSNKRSVILTWLKWGGLAAIIILSALVIYGVTMINNIQDQREEGFDESKAAVIDETDVTDVSHIDPFFEAVPYHIVFGSTSSGQGKIVFLPLDDNTDMTVINQDDVKSKGTIKETWQTTCSGCQLISIQAAMISNKPLWELTYKDKQNRHVLDYVNMETGKRYEQWKFKQQF